MRRRCDRHRQLYPSPARASRFAFRPRQPQLAPLGCEGIPGPAGGRLGGWILCDRCCRGAQGARRGRGTRRADPVAQISRRARRTAAVAPSNHGAALRARNRLSLPSLMRHAPGISCFAGGSKNPRSGRAPRPVSLLVHARGHCRQGAFASRRHAGGGGVRRIRYSRDIQAKRRDAKCGGGPSDRRHRFQSRTVPTFVPRRCASLAHPIHDRFADSRTTLRVLRAWTLLRGRFGGQQLRAAAAVCVWGKLCRQAPFATLGGSSIGPSIVPEAHQNKFARDAWLRALERTAVIEQNLMVTLPVHLERLALDFGPLAALESQGSSFTYAELASRCNQYARWGLAQGLRTGDVAALLMANCAEYPAIWLGLSRIGVAVALINVNLEGEGLAHSIRIAAPRLVLAALELAPRVAAIRGRLPP